MAYADSPGARPCASPPAGEYRTSIGSACSSARSAGTFTCGNATVTQPPSSTTSAATYKAAPSARVVSLHSTATESASATRTIGSAKRKSWPYPQASSLVAICSTFLQKASIWSVGTVCIGAAVRTTTSGTVPQKPSPSVPSCVPTSPRIPHPGTTLPPHEPSALHVDCPSSAWPNSNPCPLDLDPVLPP